MLEATDAAIASLISEVNRAGCDNQWDIARLRACLRGFLKSLVDEAARFPETLAKAQWTLFAMDHNRAEDTAFVVVVVSTGRAILVAGRGPWEAVRNHGDNFLSEDAFAVISETMALFGTTGSPIEISRAAFDEWLERT
jgi:hypothetical protein